MFQFLISDFRVQAHPPIRHPAESRPWQKSRSSFLRGPKKVATTSISTELQTVDYINSSPLFHKTQPHKMVVRIRLARFGRKRQPFYNIVVSQAR